MNYRYNVISAIAWRIVAEFLRRHNDEKDELFVMELHPCDGYVDQLSICIDNGDLPGFRLLDFNQRSGNMHVAGFITGKNKSFHEIGWRSNSFIEAFLTADDTSEVIDGIGALVGFTTYDKEKLNKITPKVLMVRIIANLLQRHGLGRETIDIRSVFDEGGYLGAVIRDEVKAYSEVYKQIPQTEIYEEMARATINFWIVNYIKTPKAKGIAKAIIDLRGGIYLHNKPDFYWNVWKEYNEGKSIAAIVSRLDKIVME
jgi:hypothetical protein